MRIFLLVSLICATAFSKPFRPRETHELPGSPYPLTYYLRTPPEAVYPLLLALQGSQCESVQAHPVADLAVVRHYGSALLMIEKPGIRPGVKTCPDEYRKRNTLDQRRTDVEAVLRHVLPKLKGWNGSLYVLGGSEGGPLASVLSERIHPKKTVLLVTGGGMPLAEAIPFALSKKLVNEGVPESERARILEEMKSTFAAIESNPTPDKTWGGTNNTYSYWRSVLRVRPVDFLMRSRSRFLLVHGTADEDHPVESARLTAKAFRDAGKSNLVYWEVPGVDHQFRDSAGASKWEEILRRSLDWLYAPTPEVTP